MLRPHTITILTTNNCTAACDHCCMYSKPGREGALTFERIRRVIDDLNNQSPLYTVVFAGGEPTLIRNDLYRSIEYCASLGIVTRIVTNASWAKTDRTAGRVLERLRDANLMELNISADDYHLPYIPFDNVKRVWRAAKGMGFSCCLITNSSGPRSLVNPEFIRKELGEDLEVAEIGNLCAHKLQPADDGTLYFISHSELQRVGRAGDLLSQDDFRLFGDESSVSGPCPFAARSAALSPTGKLLACCGFEAVGNDFLDFGDTAQHEASSLIEKANEDVILNAIAHLGPSYLMALAREKDPTLKLPDKVGSVCEVCEHVVKRKDIQDVLSTCIPQIAVAVIETKRAKRVNDNSQSVTS